MSTKTDSKPADKVADYARPNSVRSAPLKRDLPELPNWTATLPWRAVGLVALTTGLIFWLIGGMVLLAIWLLANGLDLTSTYVGVTNPLPDAGTAGRWTARTSWAAGLWTVYLSYCPELFILGGLRWLIVGRF